MLVPVGRDCIEDAEAISQMSGLTGVEPERGSHQPRIDAVGMEKPADLLDLPAVPRAHAGCSLPRASSVRKRSCTMFHTRSPMSAGT